MGGGSIYIEEIKTRNKKERRNLLRCVPKCDRTESAIYKPKASKGIEIEQRRVYRKKRKGK